jgi:dipeptidyl aminopeptidase/acylaminoacyl peptidase
MTSRPALRLALALALAACCATAPAAPPPVEAFFDDPGFGAAQLSPSGKYLAARVRGKDGRDKLAVYDLASEKVGIVAGFGSADVGSFTWVNDNRLTFDTTDHSVGFGDLHYAPGLFAVNRDGGRLRQLVQRDARFVVDGRDGNEPLPWNTYLVPQRPRQPGAGGQQADTVYVIHPSAISRNEFGRIVLQRLNTLDGTYSNFGGPPGDVRSWLLDHNNEPRLASTLDQGIETLYYRDPANDSWRKLAGVHAWTGGDGAFTPLAFGPDGTLYVIANRGSDTSALHTYDFATGSVSDKPLVQLQGYDFSGQLIISNGKLLGIRYLGESEDTVWLDPAMKALQAAVDQRLPATVNLLSVPERPETPWLLVVAYSDIQPPSTLLYNSATQALRPVGASHPAIRPAQMGSASAVHYTARDGLEIPAWLTLPPGGAAKQLPLVVLVHGGPYVRGASWGWNAEAQFLATRGYAVLQPEFRGSAGYGQRHFRAGWKQWGLRMQDDLADGARWAIAQGTADPRRICIAGASYGGYAALMGLVNDGALYRCAIAWAGVTDIQLMYDGHWSFSSDLPQQWKQYGMPQLVGDPVQDAAQLTATSPLRQAARIKRPLLLAYGGADVRVPLYHGTQFYQAVKQGNPSVEWVEYPAEGHGWDLPQTRYDFWKRVETFLYKNIGPQP